MLSHEAVVCADDDWGAGGQGAAKQIRHGGGSGIARVVQAGQSESAFQRPEEGKVGIEDIVGKPTGRKVGFHGGENVVQVGSDAIVVFVPHNDDRVVALAPNGRSMDPPNDAAQLQIAHVDKRRIQSVLRAVVIEVEV